jgi:ABC-type antimicrobial peptide transport system permease subunit
VRLDPYISADDRAFVSNGIRSFFESALTRLLEKKDIKDSVEQVNKIFNIMVYIIGAISLTIAFFLLLISTTQNVKDAIWEYGVLRACGVTMEEGQRI